MIRRSNKKMFRRGGVEPTEVVIVDTYEISCVEGWAERESKQLTTRTFFLTKREKKLEYSNIGLAARIANVVDSDKKGGTTGAQAQRRGDGQGWSVFRQRRLSRNNVRGWV